MADYDVQKLDGHFSKKYEKRIIMRIEKVLITPNIARTMLENNSQNRNINKIRVKKYANDMKKGLWTENTDLICVNEQGVLKNGQHRLSAVIEADMSFKMNVAYDVPDDLVIDKGKTRSIADSLLMSGMIDSELATNKITAMANSYLSVSEKGKYKTMSDTLKGSFIRDNGELLLKVKELSKTGGNPNGRGVALCTRAPVSAAIFGSLKAGVPEYKLIDFIIIVNTGFANSSSQSAAVVLRNYLISKCGKITGNEAVKAVAFTEMAIRDFVNCIPRKKVYTKIEHPYISHPEFNNILGEAKREVE